MQLSIIGKNMDIGEALREYVEENLSALTEKYFSNPLNGKVIVAKDANQYMVDISVHVGRNILLQASARAHEPYPAFDAAGERIEKRLRRYKRKLRDHNRDAVEEIKASQYVIDHSEASEPDSEVTEGEPTIVAEMPIMIEELTVSEAVMRLDLGELPAVMFRNRAHGGLNVIYRRADGHIGWIDPDAIETKSKQPEAVPAE
ncbi:MAG: ribosome-associated translation inhibitor RaiA [Alphaproteobacteria bacterium]|nr:ribosome-associated translation inhibitor RaiA [Alphaproteobacteria bacterium SS10]